MKIGLEDEVHRVWTQDHLLKKKVRWYHQMIISCNDRTEKCLRIQLIKLCKHTMRGACIWSQVKPGFYYFTQSTIIYLFTYHTPFHLTKMQSFDSPSILYFPFCLTSPDLFYHHCSPSPHKHTYKGSQICRQGRLTSKEQWKGRGI